MTSFPYVIINAFTRSPLGGNPAAIVRLPPGSLSPSTPIIDAPTMGAIGRSLAQPITVFVALSSSDDNGLFDIRYFVKDIEVPLCGHGTLATTKAFCSGLLQPASVQTADTPLRFKTGEGLTVCTSVSACATDDTDGELYGIELPAVPIEPLRGKDRDRVHDAVARALRKDPADLDIRLVAHGTLSREVFLMVVLNEDEVLEGRDMDANAFLAVYPFRLISLSHLTPGKAHVFESRVFAPADGIPEDQVCGTAHTLMVPYYASLPESRVKVGHEAYVKQVSPRGGDLWVTLGEKRKTIVLRGCAKLFAKGELML